MLPPWSDYMALDSKSSQTEKSKFQQIGIFPRRIFITEVIVDHFTDILLFPVTNFQNTSNLTQSSEEEFMRTSTVVYTKLLAFIAICWNEGHNPTFFVYHLQIYDHFYNIIAIEKPNISAIVKLRTVCV